MFEYMFVLFALLVLLCLVYCACVWWLFGCWFAGGCLFWCLPLMLFFVFDCDCAYFAGFIVLFWILLIILLLAFCFVFSVYCLYWCNGVFLVMMLLALLFMNIWTWDLICFAVAVCCYGDVVFVVFVLLGFAFSCCLGRRCFTGCGLLDVCVVALWLLVVCNSVGVFW